MPPTLEIKICGLTNLDDARAAWDAGADFLGFVLYRKSARGITATALRRILDRMRKGPRAIGVFVNERRETVVNVASDCGLYAVQLHGDERVEDFPSLPVLLWRAVRFREGTAIPAPEQWPADRYVMDAAVPGAYGGTGTLADWNTAAALAKRWPVMLAGGLTPENVADAIRRVNPRGVDVASGVETAPGKKDPREMEAFIRAVRSCRRTGTRVISGIGRNRKS